MTTAPIRKSVTVAAPAERAFTLFTEGFGTWWPASHTIGAAPVRTVTIEPRAQAAIIAQLRRLPEVERVHTTSGRVDLLVQLGAQSTSRLDDVLDQIGELPGVRSSESLVHLSTKLDRALG